jgi:hypothetical protein
MTDAYRPVAQSNAVHWDVRSVASGWGHQAPRPSPFPQSCPNTEGDRDDGNGPDCGQKNDRDGPLARLNCLRKRNSILRQPQVGERPQ